jgi:hypothetical protein
LNKKITSFDLSDGEKDLYNDVSRYVHEQYNKALAMEKILSYSLNC